MKKCLKHLRNSIITYLSSSSSKPVWVSFFCWAQRKIFWRMLVTKQVMVAIDYGKNNMEVKLFGHSLSWTRESNQSDSWTNNLDQFGSIDWLERLDSEIWFIHVPTWLGLSFKSDPHTKLFYWFKRFLYGLYYGAFMSILSPIVIATIFMCFNESHVGLEQQLMTKL